MGFRIRLPVFQHRVQLTFDGGALVTTDSRWTPDGSAGLVHAMQIRVDDVDAIHAQALAAGAIEDMAARDFE